MYLRLLLKVFCYHLDYQQQCDQEMQIFKTRTLGSGTSALIISNEEMKDIMKIVKTLEESWLIIKGISEKLKRKSKRTKRQISLSY